MSRLCTVSPDTPCRARCAVRRRAARYTARSRARRVAGRDTALPARRLRCHVRRGAAASSAAHLVLSVQRCGNDVTSRGSTGSNNEYLLNKFPIVPLSEGLLEIKQNCF